MEQAPRLLLRPAERLLLQSRRTCRRRAARSSLKPRQPLFPFLRPPLRCPLPLLLPQPLLLLLRLILVSSNAKFAIFKRSPPATNGTCTSWRKNRKIDRSSI